MKHVAIVSRRTYSISLIFIVGIVYLYLLFYYQYSFNFESREYGNHLLVVIANFTLLIFAGFAFFVKRLFTYVHFLLFPFLAIELYLLNYNVEYGTVLCAIAIFFLLSSVIDKERLNYLGYFLGGCGLSQLLFIGIPTVVCDASFGSSRCYNPFANTGAFSVQLVAHVPFMYLVLRKIFNTPLYFRLSASLITIVLMVIVVYLKSRTAVLAMLLIPMFHFAPFIVNFLKRQPKTIKVSFMVAAAVVALVLGYILFQFKEASSWGRTLMFNVGAMHVFDNFWLGVGIGKFEWWYPHWQAEFFDGRQANVNVNFFLSAGDSYLLFNEYLQLFLTIGFLGFSIVAVYFVRFFRVRYAGVNNGSAFWASRTAVILVLICSFTHYPLHINTILVIIAISFSLVEKEAPKKGFLNKAFTRNIVPKTVCFLLFAFSAIGLKYSVVKYSAVKKWELIKEQSFAKQRTDSETAEACFVELKDNGKFLAEYAGFVFNDYGDTVTAHRLLTESLSSYISLASLELAVFLSKETRNTTDEIKHLEFLNNLIPSKFNYKLELAKSYHGAGELNKAHHILNFIMVMPVKIPSFEIDIIKSEAQELLLEVEKEGGY